MQVVPLANLPLQRECCGHCKTAIFLPNVPCRSTCGRWAASWLSWQLGACCSRWGAGNLVAISLCGSHVRNTLGLVSHSDAVMCSADPLPLALACFLQNDSVATLLARLEGILGPLPRWMLHRGRYAHKYFVRDGRIFEKNPHTVGAGGALG